MYQCRSRRRDDGSRKSTISTSAPLYIIGTKLFSMGRERYRANPDGKLLRLHFIPETLVQLNRIIIIIIIVDGLVV